MYQGIALSLLASVLFAVQYYLSALIPGINGFELYGWRTLISVPIMTVCLLVSGHWRAVTAIMVRIVAQPALALGILLSSALMTVQQVLFIWAPLNGRGMNVALGNFLLPLVLLLVGRLFYKEKLSVLRGTAAFVAACGILYELYQVGGFSWEALTVSVGFTAYFVLRRALGTSNLGGLWLDMLLMLPFAVWCVWGGEVITRTPVLSVSAHLAILAIGLCSAVAFMVYITASRLLPFTVFGLMGYVEPVLLVFVALLLGESIAAREWPMYLAIWGAVGLLALDGIANVLLRGRRKY
ncbi:EamA family transporter RarD [Pantoea sp. A4]|uniref:EamA family transporter RarD n=1 Tax=Pantoea sp. A4 TaxID=1225184 RepID=UPI00035E6615|nr:EamA family transporter RarD [Pantoea sp. A4]